MFIFSVFNLEYNATHYYDCYILNFLIILPKNLIRFFFAFKTNKQKTNIQIEPIYADFFSFYIFIEIN